MARLMNNPVQVGLIGCGHAAENLHLPALRLVPEAEVVAVADKDPARLERVARRFEVPRCWTDYRYLLDEPAIQAVAVCVPPQFHVEVGVAALAAGKHVLVEKPLALDLAGCDRLIEQARLAPGKATVGFNLRWHRLVRRARALLRDGALGPVEWARSVFSSGFRFRNDFPAWRKGRGQGGGAFFEIAVHHFDLWRFLLGEVVEVFAASRSGSCEDETAAVTARLEGDVLATSVFSQVAAESNEVEISGRDARLRLSCYRFDGLELAPAGRVPGNVRDRMRQLAHTLHELPAALVRAGQGGDMALSYAEQWRHFLRAIRENEAPDCTLADGRRALEVVQAAVQSAELGRAIAVGSPHSRRPPLAA